MTIETYNTNTGDILANEAYLSVSSLYSYLDKCSPGITQAMNELLAALTTVECVRDKIYFDPHGPYIAIPSTPPRVVCRQCQNRQMVPINQIPTDTTLAPQEVGEPGGDTYTYIPICGDCLTDWWGVEDLDKPAGAPDYITI